MMFPATTLGFPQPQSLGTQDLQMMRPHGPFHTLKAKSCL